MMHELAAKLGFCDENSTPSYPQANGQVEATNKFFKTMLQLMVANRKSNWNIILLSMLWEYQTSVKYSIGFTPFQFVYKVDSILSIQCKICSKFVYLDGAFASLFLFNHVISRFGVPKQIVTDQGKHF